MPTPVTFATPTRPRSGFVAFVPQLRLLALALLAWAASAMPARAQLVAPPQGLAQAGWRAACAPLPAGVGRVMEHSAGDRSACAATPRALQPRSSAPRRETRRST